MLGGIGIDQLEIEDIEAKEIQADREGLLMMAMVGFDPQKVAGDNSRFFEEWIESIWGQSCGKGADAGDCAKAKARSERARAHWLDTANQAVLFDLGIQAYVAGEYAAARQYFMVYGRQFPSREIHNNIGLTYVEEALILRKKLLTKGENLGPEFVYPYVLEGEPGLIAPPKGRGREGEATRRGGDPEVIRWRKEMEKALSDAAESFDRALKIDPAHRPSYWNLAATHLLAGNAPLAYGVLAGNYTKRFGQDAFASMLLGIVAYLDDNPKKAGALLNKAAAEATPELIPLARMNLAVYYRAMGDQEGERTEWKRLADWGRKNGDEGLFRLSLKRMGKEADPTAPPGLPAVEKIHGYTLSQRVPAALPQALETVGNEVWIEGERIQIYRLAGGGGGRKLSRDQDRGRRRKAQPGLWHPGPEDPDNPGGIPGL